jgi:hypothetical protein
MIFDHIDPLYYIVEDFDSNEEIPERFLRVLLEGKRLPPQVILIALDIIKFPSSESLTANSE